MGLGLGILLSKLAELLLCNMLQFEIRYAWEFIPRAFLRTGSIFLLYAALMRSTVCGSCGRPSLWSCCTV